MPIVTAPYAGADWRANLRDLTQRRVRVFEAMLPFRLAANIKRYQSPFLMAEYTRVVRLERELVLRLLPDPVRADRTRRSEEHTSELQSLMRISYAVFCLKKKKTKVNTTKSAKKTRVRKLMRIVH